MGNTGLKVSEICFGTLTLGPLQKKLNVNDGLKVLKRAYEKGINFYDTADLYNTYSYLSKLIEIDKDIIICTKSYDYSKEGLERSLNRALKELNRDYVDIYLLHEQESRYTFEGHQEALDALKEARRQGKVRAIGVSTHRISAVEDSTDFNDIEVVFPLLNPQGLGIEDGSSEEMLEAIKKARNFNKGIFTMKPLGGGNLIRDRFRCLDFQKELLRKGLIDSMAIGMSSIDEVDFNTDYVIKNNVSSELINKTNNIKRKLIIDDWCELCGSCIKKCHQNALEIKDNKVHINRDRCLTCGYCSSACPVFAIKVI